MMKKQLQPKLRFPDFEEDWEIKFIKDIFKINAGGDIDNKNVQEFKDDIFKYPVYANAEKRKGLFGYTDEFKVEAPSITVAGRGVNIGIAHFRNENYYPIVRLLTLKSKIDIDYKFFEYSLNNINYFVESTGVPQLTGPQVGIYSVSFPSLPEQQKIADYLSTIDTKINLLEEKKEQLSQYKKAMMQKLFAQEIRFKDENGKEFPKWKEKRLGEITNINKGQQLNKENFIEDGNYKVLNGGISHSGFTNSFNRKGNIITISEGGNSCGYSNYMKEDFWLGGHCYALDNLKNNIHDKFLFQNLKFNESKIMRLRVGSGLPNIQKGDLSKLSVIIPPLAEQQKIANFLSAIDESIDKVNEQMTQTQSFKKAMLQQMFV